RHVSATDAAGRASPVREAPAYLRLLESNPPGRWRSALCAALDSIKHHVYSRVKRHVYIFVEARRMDAKKPARGGLG
ncbi:hypothetical protein KDX27_40615, partial [Burkholderia cenocepacia]|uniref:hypothetical protein n=1 Tax=Burkholderia cenocepacia TaxID=95486 RepID=UPI001B9A3532